MSKAMELLKRDVEVASKEGGSAVAPDREIDVATFGRKVRVNAVARLYRILSHKKKALEADIDVLKHALRSVGQECLDAMAENGQYCSRVKVGGVPVTRANKFRKIPYTQDEMIEAIGETEYRLAFNAGARIEFADIDSMRDFKEMCRVAGLGIEGKIIEEVTPTSKFIEFLCRVGRTLPEDKLALLKKCAQDQAPRVGGK